MLILDNSKINRSKRPTQKIDGTGLKEKPWITAQFGTTLVQAGASNSDDEKSQDSWDLEDK